MTASVPFVPSPDGVLPDEDSGDLTISAGQVRRDAESSAPRDADRAHTADPPRFTHERESSGSAYATALAEATGPQSESSESSRSPSLALESDEPTADTVGEPSADTGRDSTEELDAAAAEVEGTVEPAPDDATDVEDAPVGEGDTPETTDDEEADEDADAREAIESAAEPEETAAETTPATGIYASKEHPSAASAEEAVETTDDTEPALADAAPTPEDSVEDAGFGSGAATFESVAATVPEVEAAADATPPEPEPEEVAADSMPPPASPRLATDNERRLRRALEALQANQEMLAHSVAEIAEKFIKLEGAFNRLVGFFNQKFRHDQTKEAAFEKLYEDLKLYRENFLHRAQRPVFMDLIRLYDDTMRYEADTRDERAKGNLEMIREMILEILYRRDIELIADPPEVFDPATQKAMRRELTGNPAEDKEIVASLRDGFLWQGSVLRPQEVVVKRYDEGAAPPTRDPLDPKEEHEAGAAPPDDEAKNEANDEVDNEAGSHDDTAAEPTADSATASQDASKVKAPQAPDPGLPESTEAETPDAVADEAGTS